MHHTQQTGQPPQGTSLVPSEPKPAIAKGFAGVGVPGLQTESIAATVRRLIDSGDESWQFSSLPMSAQPTLSEVINYNRVRRGPSVDVQEAVNKPLTIQNVIIHPASTVDDQTGELKRFPRLLLITPDGIVYSSGAWSLVDQVSELMAFGLVPPWKPPLNVTIRQQGTSGNRRIYVMEFAPNAKGKTE